MPRQEIMHRPNRDRFLVWIMLPQQAAQKTISCGDFGFAQITWAKLGQLINDAFQKRMARRAGQDRADCAQRIILEPVPDRVGLAWICEQFINRVFADRIGIRHEAAEFIQNFIAHHILHTRIIAAPEIFVDQMAQTKRIACQKIIVIDRVFPIRVLRGPCLHPMLRRGFWANPDMAQTPRDRRNRAHPKA